MASAAHRPRGTLFGSDSKLPSICDYDRSIASMLVGYDSCLTGVSGLGHEATSRGIDKGEGNVVPDDCTIWRIRIDGLYYFAKISSAVSGTLDLSFRRTSHDGPEGISAGADLGLSLHNHSLHRTREARRLDVDR